MSKSEFKVGDKVKIVRNDIQPGVTGKIGVIKKVYSSFCGDEHCLYRVTVGGSVLRGVATPEDLEKI